MGESIKVSVIIAAYNAEEYLSRCLDSVRAQTLRDIEIICVDDGSTDGTGEILEIYAARDKRIKIVSQENKGAGAARNRGFKEASGRYVIFLDADDFFHKGMLKAAYGSAEKNEAEIVIFRSEEYDSNTKKYIPSRHTIRKEELPPNNPFCYKDMPDCIFTFAVGWAWDKLYRRSFVVRNRLCFQEIRTSNDLCFVYSSLVKAKRIYALDRVLAYHRVTCKDSLSATREKSWDCFYVAMKALKQELEDMGIYSEVERGFLNWAAFFSLWNLDTLTGGSYKKVFLLLKEKCYPEFGMDGRDQGYYRNNEYHDRIREIMGSDYEEYVCRNMVKFRNRALELGNVDKSLSLRIGSAILWVPKRVMEIIRRERVNWRLWKQM